MRQMPLLLLKIVLLTITDAAQGVSWAVIGSSAKCPLSLRFRRALRQLEHMAANILVN